MDKNEDKIKRMLYKNINGIRHPNRKSEAKLDYKKKLETEVKGVSKHLKLAMTDDVYNKVTRANRNGYIAWEIMMGIIHGLFMAGDV